MTQRFDISDIPISKRWSFIFAERGYLEVDGNAVVLRQGKDNLTHLPIGASACLMDDINKAISVANVTLYSLAEAVILTLGYSPAIGFVHSGHARSFAFDIADTIKVETTIDLAFRVIKESPEDVEGSVRRKCRDLFKEQRIAGK
ncbi:MAG: hypothetical protein GY862_37745, partial [Gammaproteobacteria bacterium]|nr:hypothetical protein [Gammaproteobacteria bacterium]